MASLTYPAADTLLFVPLGGGRGRRPLHHPRAPDQTASGFCRGVAASFSRSHGSFYLPDDICLLSTTHFGNSFGQPLGAPHTRALLGLGSHRNLLLCDLDDLCDLSFAPVGSGVARTTLHLSGSGRIRDYSPDARSPVLF